MGRHIVADGFDLFCMFTMLCYLHVKVVAGLCHSIVYGLLCFVLDQFHAETLGSDTQVSSSSNSSSSSSCSFVSLFMDYCVL